MRFYLEPESDLVKQIEGAWGKFPDEWLLLGADDDKGGMILDTQRFEHAPMVERFVAENAPQWNPDKHPEVHISDYDLDVEGGIVDGAERDGVELSTGERWLTDEAADRDARAEARANGLVWSAEAQTYINPNEQHLVQDFPSYENSDAAGIRRGADGEVKSITPLTERTVREVLFDADNAAAMGRDRAESYTAAARRRGLTIGEVEDARDRLADRTREHNAGEAQLDAIRDEIERRVDKRVEVEIDPDAEWTVYEGREAAIYDEEREQVTTEHGVTVQDLAARDSRIDHEREARLAREEEERRELGIAPF